MDGKTAVGAQRTPQVTEQMERLDKAMSRASDVQARMQERLQSVMVAEAPGATSDGPACVDDCLVPVADTMRCLYRQLDAMTDQYESMLQLIEL